MTNLFFVCFLRILRTPFFIHSDLDTFDSYHSSNRLHDISVCARWLTAQWCHLIHRITFIRATTLLSPSDLQYNLRSLIMYNRIIDVKFDFQRWRGPNAKVETFVCFSILYINFATFRSYAKAGAGEARRKARFRG